LRQDCCKKKEDQAIKIYTKNQDGELKSPQKRKQNEMTPAGEKQPQYLDSKNASLKSTTAAAANEVFQ
jgi:hypothetical protein